MIRTTILMVSDWSTDCPWRVGVVEWRGWLCSLWTMGSGNMLSTTLHCTVTRNNMASTCHRNQNVLLVFIYKQERLYYISTSSFTLKLPLLYALIDLGVDWHLAWRPVFWCCDKLNNTNTNAKRVQICAWNSWAWRWKGSRKIVQRLRVMSFADTSDSRFSYVTPKRKWRNFHYETIPETSRSSG
jgi:hypothetical protein